MNMLRNIKFYLSALAILVGATSCLDKYPGSSIPEKEAMRTFADAEQTLTGIYAQAQNLFTFTKFTGLDPEGSSNMYQAQYPMARQFTFGLDLTF